MRTSLTFFLLALSLSSFTQIDNTNLSLCQPDWTFFETGSNWGLRGMISVDLDEDGLIEVITTAEGVSDDHIFWQVGQFSSEEQAFEYLYRSDVQDDAKTVKRIAVEQLDTDPQLEIVVVYGDNQLVQYDGISFEVEQSLSFPFTDFVYTIVFGDANNDGVIEMIISDEENIHFFVTSNWSHLESLQAPEIRSIAVGDSDNDGQQEFVTSTGIVYHWDGNNFSIEWNAPYNDESIAIREQVYLEDIDNDQIPEIIIARRSNIVVSDGDIQSQKYSRNVGFFQNILLADVDGDGDLEFACTDSSKRLTTYSATTGSPQGTYDLPWNGNIITTLSANDFNHDNEVEILLANDAFLEQFHIPSGKVKWLSSRYNASPYKIGKVEFDEDPTEEIYAVSSASILEDTLTNQFKQFPRLYVFDGATNEIQWRSPADFFLAQIANPFFGLTDQNDYDFAFTDFNNDDIEDIIFAYYNWTTDSTTFVAYDGVSKEILHQNDVEFDQFSSNIHLEDPIDIDLNGTIDILLFGEGEGILILDSLFNTQRFFEDNQVDNQMHKIGNIDADPQLEIVLLRSQYLQVIDGLTLESWIDTEERYSVFDLHDLTNDGTQEIIAAAGLNDGQFNIYDGTSLTPIANQNYEFPYNSFQSLDVVGGTLDSIELYVGGKQLSGPAGHNIIYIADGNVHISPVVGLGYNTQLDPLLVSDVNQSGYQNIFILTSSGIVELPEICFTCARLITPLVVEQPNCLNNQLGRLDLNLSLAFGEMEFLWSDGSNSDSLVMLPPGEYSVVVSNNLGCVGIQDALLSFTPLAAEFSMTADCGDDMSGSITSSAVGTLPLEWEWDNGAATPSLTNLSGGWYQVTITDAAFCVLEDSILIPSSSLELEFGTFVPDCYGVDSAQIWIDTLVNSASPTWVWSTGASMVDTISIAQTSFYSVQVTDSLDCTYSEGVFVEVPREITINPQIFGDNGDTPAFDGFIALNPQGGTPPFSFDWADLDAPINESTRSGLPPGDYSVIVIDALGCSVTYELIVPLITSSSTIEEVIEINLFPNPAQRGQLITLSQIGNHSNIHEQSLNNLQCRIYSSDGIQQRMFPISSENTLPQFSTEGLPSGIYIVVIEEGGIAITQRKLLIF